MQKKGCMLHKGEIGMVKKTIKIGVTLKLSDEAARKFESAKNKTEFLEQSIEYKHQMEFMIEQQTILMQMISDLRGERNKPSELERLIVAFLAYVDAMDKSMRQKIETMKSNPGAIIKFRKPELETYFEGELLELVKKYMPAGK
jgi:type III secretion system FlhB-like substrate exporter